MTLDGTVRSAPPGLMGFDANTVLSPATARIFFASGYKFCFRYISRTDEPPSDLGPQEAEDILSAGLALMPVQHVRPGTWVPTDALGMQDGSAAAKNADAVGFPPGVCVWCDLEAVELNAAPQDVIDYCNAWFGAVNSVGYLPGLYVGYQSLLSEQQLFQLSFTHYWRSQSNVPNVGGKGYQVLQLYPEIPINGIRIDVDVTQNDYRGGQAKWLAR
jgi:hypothetical protein